MRNQRKRHLIRPKTLIGMLAVVAGIGLIGKVSQNLPRGSASAVGLAVLVAVASIIAAPIVRLLRRAGARRAVRRQAIAITQQHLPTLSRRRAQLVRLDPYGKPRADRWIKEIDYFIEQHIQPSLTPRKQMALEACHPEVAGLIDARVAAAMLDQPAFSTFSNDMTPAEFETFCAEELRRAGWDARVTMAGRDQGVDVIAAKNGCRVVLQCKLYARPVGNKSVQEATAARAHEQADFGIVVSNNRYTGAAEQLAASNRVLLLHYRDLQRLDEILDRPR